MPIYVGDTTDGRTATTLSSTGSTWFGNSTDDVHNFKGTLYLTGAAVFNMAAASTGDFTVKSTTSNHMFFVDSSAGRIGVGTSSPDVTLHVKSAGTTHIEVESESGYEAALKVKAGGQSSAYIWQPGSTSDLRFYVNSADRMHIDNDGSVGVGTTSPAAQIHATGSFILAAPPSGSHPSVSSMNNGEFTFFYESSTLKVSMKVDGAEMTGSVASVSAVSGGGLSSAGLYGDGSYSSGGDTGYSSGMNACSAAGSSAGTNQGWYRNSGGTQVYEDSAGSTAVSLSSGGYFYLSNGGSYYRFYINTAGVVYDRAPAGGGTTTNLDSTAGGVSC